MFRRRGAVDHRGPGLARTVARTAVISGTATATSGAVASRQARRHQDAMDRQSVEQLQNDVTRLQGQEVQEQMSPTGGGDELISQLSRLGELHHQGILNAEEFAKAKSRLLDG